MRQRYFWLASGANARWPGDVQGVNLRPFNWVKIDNRGANDVVVGLAAPSASDMDYYVKVKAGKWRVFNVAGPVKEALEPGPAVLEETELHAGDAMLRELYLMALTGVTTVMIEISDTPIIDMGFQI